MARRRAIRRGGRATGRSRPRNAAACGSHATTAEAVGIAVAHDSGDERYVGELFVEPSYRGQGIGARLLAAAFEDAGDADRMMLLDASDPAAVALALRFGAAPRETVLRFAGAIPREEELAKMAAGQYRFEVDTIDADRHAPGLDEMDRQARGDGPARGSSRVRARRDRTRVLSQRRVRCVRLRLARRPHRAAGVRVGGLSRAGLRLRTRYAPARARRVVVHGARARLEPAHRKNGAARRAEDRRDACARGCVAR